MNSKIAGLAAAAAAVGLTIPAAGAAHNATGDVTCQRVTLGYSQNADGPQRSTETVWVDGEQIYGPRDRVWQTSGPVDTFNIPISVDAGVHTITWLARFVGSDGYRYTRSGSAVVTCDGPLTIDPVAPAPPNGPPPPVVAAPTAPAVPATPSTPARPRKPVRRVTRRVMTTRPTRCYVSRVKPRNGVSWRTTPRPGQIRVRWHRGRWIGFRGERHRILVVRVQHGTRSRTIRRVVGFTPGRFCGRLAPRTAG